MTKPKVSRRGFLAAAAAVVAAPAAAILPKAKPSQITYQDVMKTWDTLNSRPQFRTISLKLHTLSCQTYVSQELLNDTAVSLERWCAKGTRRSRRRMINA